MTEPEIAIPSPSLERLRQAYAQFDQLALIIAEAVGIEARQSRQLDMERGVFLVGQNHSANGRVNEADGRFARVGSVEQ
jgi:hypothetical protein